MLLRCPHICPYGNVAVSCKIVLAVYTYYTGSSIATGRMSAGWDSCGQDMKKERKNKCYNNYVYTQITSQD